MRIKITQQITKYELVWAVWQLAIQGHRSEYGMGKGFHYLFKKDVIDYLRDQMCQFGHHEDSLMGSNYRYDIEESPEDYAKCVEWVEKKWPDIKEQSE